MKVLILSDIHANLEALEEVFKFVKEDIDFDEIVILGDYVDYGPNPNEVIEFIKDLKGTFLLGNHDNALLDRSERNMFSDLALKCSLWTEKVIKPENLEFIRKLKPSYRINDILFVHASPVDPLWHYVHSFEDAYEVFRSSQARIIFVGHTHVPSYFVKYGNRVSGGYITAKYAKIKLLDDARYIINPGSVGQPRDGIPLASFGIYDDEKREFSWFRIPYPNDITKRKIIEYNLPVALVSYL